MPYPDNMNMAAYDRAQGRDDTAPGRDELIARAENKNKAAALIIANAKAALRALDLEDVPCLAEGYGWEDIMDWPMPFVTKATSQMLEDWADEQTGVV